MLSIHAPATSLSFSHRMGFLATAHIAKTALRNKPASAGRSEVGSEDRTGLNALHARASGPRRLAGSFQARSNTLRSSCKPKFSDGFYRTPRPLLNLDVRKIECAQQRRSRALILTQQHLGSRIEQPQSALRCWTARRLGSAESC